jgi:hypothetical protein
MTVSTASSETTPPLVWSLSGLFTVLASPYQMILLYQQCTRTVVATSRGQQARTEFVQFNICHGIHHCRCKNSILAGIKKQLSDFMPLVTRRSAVRSAYRIIFFLPSFLLHSLRKRIPAGEELVGSRSDDRGQLPSSSTTNFLYCMVFFSIKEIY